MASLTGKTLPIDKAKLPFPQAGFLPCRGLFETMRAYRGRIAYLKQHLDRLNASARILGINIPYPSRKLAALVHQAVKEGGFQDTRVRLTVWKQEKQAGILVSAKKYPAPAAEKYKKGFSVTVPPFRQSDYSLARFKTTSRLLYELSFDYARAAGFDEALILNSRAEIAEASRSNIFFANSGELFTPALACGCLDGITRQAVLGLAGKLKIKVYCGKFTLKDLYAAQEAFLTNSLMGVMPLAQVERRRIGKGKCGKITNLLQEKYACLLK